MVTTRSEKQKLDIRSDERCFDSFLFVFPYESEPVECLWCLKIVLDQRQSAVNNVLRARSDITGS